MPNTTKQVVFKNNFARPVLTIVNANMLSKGEIAC